MTDIEKLKQLISEATKLHKVDYTSDPVIIEVIRGMNPDPCKPNIIVDRIVLKREDALVNYLQSNDVLCKLLSPEERGILLLDVVGYSRFDTLGQAAILTLLKETIDAALFAQGMFSRVPTIEQIIPTGDGCYIVFNEALNDRFARIVCGIKAELHCRQVRLLRKDQDLIQVIMACHIGTVDFFQDTAGNRNCFGTGMNEAARILDIGKQVAKSKYPNKRTEGTVFLSETVLSQAQFIQTYLNEITSHKDIEIDYLGEHPDKHNLMHHIHWLTGLSNHATIAFDTVLGNGVQPVFIRA